MTAAKKTAKKAAAAVKKVAPKKTAPKVTLTLADGATLSAACPEDFDPAAHVDATGMLSFEGVEVPWAEVASWEIK